VASVHQILDHLGSLLDPAAYDEFESQYAEVLRAAYPRRSDVTLFPFRRIFAVGHKI